MSRTTTTREGLGSAPWILSVLLVLSAGFSSASAIGRPDLLNGPPVMLGSMRGTAGVVLVAALPVLVVAMAGARRGSLLGLAAWIGSVVFVGYQGGMFLFGLPFNGLFLAYVAMFGSGFWALVSLALRVPAAAHGASFSPGMPVRLLGGWMAVSCFAFYGLWLKNVVPASFDSVVPAFLAGSGMVTPTNYVLDMALFLPFTLLVAAALWRRTPWGLVMGGALLLTLALESVAIAVDQWAGSSADPSSSVASAAMTPAFLVVAVIGVVMLGLWVRGTMTAQHELAPAT